MPSIIVRHFRRQLPVRLSQGVPNRRPRKECENREYFVGQIVEMRNDGSDRAYREAD
jgi:hypothetical protein